MPEPERNPLRDMFFNRLERALLLPLKYKLPADKQKLTELAAFSTYQDLCNLGEQRMVDKVIEAIRRRKNNEKDF
jgi:hypothetical protein